MRILHRIINDKHAGTLLFEDMQKEREKFISFTTMIYDPDLGWNQKIEFIMCDENNMPLFYM